MWQNPEANFVARTWLKNQRFTLSLDNRSDQMLYNSCDMLHKRCGQISYKSFKCQVVKCHIKVVNGYTKAVKCYTNVVKCNRQYKSCHLQFVHTKAIIAWFWICLFIKIFVTVWKSCQYLLPNKDLKTYL